MRSFSRIALFLVVVACSTGAATAQTFRYMAFGDSITKGRTEFDSTGQGGYVGRLDDLLGCTLPDCEVINEGKDGEKTGAGVTRIENLLENEGPWDIVLLMEGTNDVFNNISNNTIKNNLTMMDTKARDLGVDTLHASLIHFDEDSEAGQDSGKVADIEDLRTRIQDLATARNRYFADPWTPLCPGSSCFSSHYHNPPGAVGHPDESGFDILADEFRDTIIAVPVPGNSAAIRPIGIVTDNTPIYQWTREPSNRANWYQVRVTGGSGEIHNEWFQENSACNTTTCTVLFSGILADGNYNWEVRGRNPRGRSGWVVTNFTVQTLLPPTEVTPTAPLGVIGVDEPVLEWSQESPIVAGRYDLEVYDALDVLIFSDDVPALGNCGGSVCTFDAFVGNPLNEEAHSWRVRGSNTAGDGPWSDELDFEVNLSLLFYDGFESGDTTHWSSTQQ